MSYAILHLHLEHPPSALERVVIDTDTMWASRCYACGGRSRPYPLISNAMQAQHHHGIEHIEHERAELATLLDAPVAIPRRRSDAGIRRRQQLDRVYAHEPKVA